MDAKIESGLTVSVSLWTAVDMNKYQLKRCGIKGEQYTIIFLNVQILIMILRSLKCMTL